MFGKKWEADSQTPFISNLSNMGKTVIRDRMEWQFPIVDESDDECKKPKSKLQAMTANKMEIATASVATASVATASVTRRDAVPSKFLFHACRKLILTRRMSSFRSSTSTAGQRFNCSGKAKLQLYHCVQFTCSSLFSMPNPQL